MKPFNERRSSKRNVLALAMVAGIAGCATTPPPALEQARSEYRDAAQDPHISRYAPVALHDAEQALQRAEQALERDRDRVPHLAYVTQQRVQIARANAQKAMAIERMDQLAQEREQVLLDARSLQAQQAQQQAQRAEQRSQQLEQELEALKARETERGTELTIPGVLFATDRAELKPGAMHNLQPLVDYLQANPQRNLLIEGHTDSTGSEQYNLELSNARAAAVRDFFIARGIARERLTTHGYGQRFPVAPNDNPAGRQENRRVNLVILKEGQDPRQVLQ